MTLTKISVASAILYLFSATSFILAVPVHAHHSFQAFDMQRTITIEGVVTDFDLRNPHAYLTMEVTGAQGQVDIWEIETVAANLFRRNGVDENTFPEGERVSVEVNPPRNTSRYMANGIVFTKSGGAQFFARGAPGQSTENPTPSFADSIEGIWMGPAPQQGLALIDKEVVSNSWPLTTKGSNLLDAYNGSQTDSVNCVAYSAPSLVIIPAPISIEITDTVVTMRIPNESAVRYIYVDGRAHPETTEASNQGHSIGHWDGEALVIDTIHFSEHLLGNAFGLPSGFEKHLIERLALNEDRSKLDYSFTLEDPEYLTGQVTRNFQWTYSPNADLDIEPCDLENARRFLNAY